MSKKIPELTPSRATGVKAPRNISEFKRLEPVIFQCIVRRGYYNQFIEVFENYVGDPFPEKPNAVLVKDGVHFCRLAPSEVWIIGSTNETGVMPYERKTALENWSSMFDHTQGYITVELSGPQDRDRLSHGVALDLSAPNFLAPSAAFISVDSIPGFILKTGEHPTFWLAVSKSYFSFFELWWQKIAVQ